MKWPKWISHDHVWNDVERTKCIWKRKCESCGDEEVKPNHNLEPTGGQSNQYRADWIVGTGYHTPYYKLVDVKCTLCNHLAILRIEEIR